MIVRIAGEGQFTVDDDTLARLNELDNQTVAAVDGGDEARFKDLFAQLIELVRSDGVPLDDDELVGSGVFIPPADTTFEQAREEFTGDGLIPG